MQIAGRIVNIEQVVMDELNLDRVVIAGDEIRACCPFHKELNPSFGINIRTGLFNCFSCGTRGNFQQLVKEIKGFSYEESVDFLINYSKKITREKYCEELVNKINGKQEEKHKESSEIPPLYIPKGIYIGNKKRREEENGKRKSLGNEEVISHPYLRRRGINLPTQKRFGIFYNREERRVIAPLLDEDGNVVALIKRTVMKIEPKVLYEPEGLKLTDKLYGVGVIEPTREVILVEGFIDALKVYQSKPGRAVYAVLGSRVHAEQISWLKKNGVREIVLHFDGDAAGIKGMAEAVPNIYQAGMLCKLAGLPKGKNDPGECHRGELKYIYAHTMNAGLWLAELEKKAKGGRGIEESNRLIKWQPTM